MTALYNGVNGVKTAEFGHTVIGSDITNINIAGYKSSTVEFKSLFSTTLRGASNSPVTSQIGLGSTKMATSLNFAQGNLQPTDKVFDMAIDGDGFFGLIGANGEQYFTRDGDFALDVNRDMVNRSGLYLLGTMANLSSTTLGQSALNKLGVVDGNVEAYTLLVGENVELNSVNTQTKINLPEVLYIPATPTTKVSYAGFLNSTIDTEHQEVALNTQSLETQIDKDNNTIIIAGNLHQTPEIHHPNSVSKDVKITITDQNGKSVEVTGQTLENGAFVFGVDNAVAGLNLDGELTYEAIAFVPQQIATPQRYTTDIWAPNGDKNILQLEFTKQVPQGENIAFDALVSVLSPDGEMISVTQGELRYNERGALISNTLGAINNGGANLELNLGTPYDPNIPNSGFDGLRPAEQSNPELSVAKNGKSEGLLHEYTMSDSGDILAVFDNGDIATVAKVALYHFQNNQGLSKASENTYQATANSGDPIFYTNADGEVIYGAVIRNHMLEMSNVDLGVSLTDMVVMQKMYEASAKSITTADEMIKNAINLKR
ncbi:flagellar hook-basal body complex protein [Campylobacter lanienae]|uniref:flagellar hook-basal body complex protein n=1 Tax=Campylobacter lanienae TaxID=75658 RepID=UPI002A9088CF|nr:flagellar hook-basal body complex protein [Campylobacter lanienae]MDY6134641.1 flagellar hook-basal body complex protein [Campylobacter lanienae]